jgi:hypothetical protein
MDLSLTRLKLQLAMLGQLCGLSQAPECHADIIPHRQDTGSPPPFRNRHTTLGAAPHR